MQLHELSCDGQAESQSSMGTRRAGLLLAEPIEDVRQEVRTNSLAGIGDDEIDFALLIVARCRDRHRALLRKLHRIGHKIPHDLL